MFLWPGSSEILPDRCAVAGCSNIPDAEKGIALKKIPFYGDGEAKARRKKWTDFVKLKGDRWAPSVSYALCSCHFAPEDLTLRLSFGNLKCQRTLIKDNIGVLPVPKFQHNSWGEEDLSDRSRRQVSHATLAYNHIRFTDVV